jgi:hypothetical protein
VGLEAVVCVVCVEVRVAGLGGSVVRLRFWPWNGGGVLPRCGGPPDPASSSICKSSTWELYCASCSICRVSKCVRPSCLFAGMHEIMALPNWTERDLRFLRQIRWTWTQQLICTNTDARAYNYLVVNGMRQVGETGD